jgi:hypothetical protein
LKGQSGRGGRTNRNSSSMVEDAGEPAGPAAGMRPAAQGDVAVTNAARVRAPGQARKTYAAKLTSIAKVGSATSVPLKA